MTGGLYGHDNDLVGNGVDPDQAPREPLTELGVARRMVAAFGHRLRYVPVWRRWYAWDGRRWTVDDTGEAARCAKAIGRNLLTRSATISDDKIRKAVIAAAQRAESARGVAASLALAGTEPQIAVRPEDFDADPWLLNTANGVLDLRTRELRPHDPTLLLTKMTRAAYDITAPVAEFTKFLERIQPDPDMRSFIARLLGHALPGTVIEHLLAVLYGPGANGKSTLLETVMAALGDYATTTDPGLLIDRGEAHPTGIADLFGRRLAVTHETDAGRRLAEATVKRLTGGDRIKARRMREDFWEFDPSHTVVMVTNHRPIVRGDDEGIWRRLRLVPFDVVVPPAERDPDLKTRLIQEVDGILAWLVAGYTDWHARGLDEPTPVRDATASYRADSDQLGRFLDERCMTMTGATVRSAELYAAWCGWCDTEGIDAGSQTAFSLAVIERGYDPPKRTKTSRIWRGLGLYTDQEEAS